MRFVNYGLVLLPAVTHAQFRRRAQRRQPVVTNGSRFRRKSDSSTSNTGLTKEHGRKVQVQDPQCGQAIQDYSEPTSTCSCTNLGDGLLSVSCNYDDCEACYKQGMTDVCARLFYGVTLQDVGGLLNEIFYEECTEYTKGPSLGETICYSEIPQNDLLGQDFSCELQVNNQFCNSCTEQCMFDCVNIPGGDVFDLCSDTGSETSPNSVFYPLFAKDLFDECFRVIQREPGGVIAGTLTDPHIYTFDGLEYDCQGAGEFILAASPRLEIQGRFNQVGTSQLPASITSGIAVSIQDEPVVQVSLLPDAIDIDCIPILFMDGNEIFLFEDTGDPGVVIHVVDDDRLVVSFTRVNVEVTVLIRQSDAFGCFFSTFVYLPSELRENVSGLFGSPNQVIADEWSDPAGTVFPLPVAANSLHFEHAYDYCTTHWCIRNEQDSLFTYDATENFALYFDCGNSFYSASTLREGVISPTPELEALCGQDIACLIDGTVGSVADATVYLEDRALLESLVQELIPSPPVVTQAPPPPPPPPPKLSKGKGTWQGKWRGMGKGNNVYRTKGANMRSGRERWKSKWSGMSMSMKSGKKGKMKSMKWTKWKQLNWKDRKNKNMNKMTASPGLHESAVFGDAPPLPLKEPTGAQETAPYRSNFVFAKMTKPKPEMKNFGSLWDGTS